MSHRILVPIDLAQEAVFQSVFAAVNAEANVRKSDVLLLTIIPERDDDYFPSQTLEQAIADTVARLRRLGEQRLRGVASWDAVAFSGHSPAAEIVRTADDYRADLIIMASHNPQFSDFVFGSVADRVVRHAHHSVLVVRQGGSAGTTAGEQTEAMA